jgi:transposase
MFEHSPKAIKTLYQWAKKAAGETIVHFCMEATGVYSQRLAVYLTLFPEVQISIINPAQIASFAKAQLRRCKTDLIDAQVILEFAQSQKPPLWKPASKALRQLLALVTQADAIRLELRQWDNRQHSQSYIPDLPQMVVTTSASIKRALQRQLDNLEQHIKELCDSDVGLRTQIKLLRSIPGIGELTAHRLLAYGHKALTERDRKALTAHAGLAPRHRQSGSSLHGKSYIAKQGDRRLRKTLYMPALVAAKYNPLIKSFYQRLLANGKPKKLALIACMRKLLLLTRAILITQKPFNPQINA